MKSLNCNLASKLSKDIQYHFEPGRFIIANAGILIASVIYIKSSGGENFAILNAGMNNLIRPAMYDSYHEITPILRREKQEVYNFAGPICESSDFFAKNRKTATLHEGDFVAILCSGAYGQSMASMYNARSIVPEFIIENNKVRKIRKEIKLSDIASYFYN
jgi:diaminopimelate decarboxylase